MALDRFARKVSGIWTEFFPITSSAGAADGGRIVATDEATGRFSESLMPVGIGADVRATLLSETVTSGSIVHLHNVAGVLKARNADAATSGKPARGYVPAGGAADSTKDVYFDGTISGLSGLTPGGAVYLSATVPGGVTHTCPTGDGVNAQSVGVALSATEITFELGEAYIQEG